MKPLRFPLPLFLMLSVFSFSGLAESILGGKTFFRERHSLDFNYNWKVVETGYNSDGTGRRECAYYFGDFTLWDEEGLVVNLICDGNEIRYILSPESDYLSRNGLCYELRD